MKSMSSTSLVQAACDNHRSWFRARCIAQGGTERNSLGIPWLCSASEAIIPFPSNSALNSNQWLASVLQRCETERTSQISCWSATENDSEKLGAILMSHGFEWGWRPTWMALNLVQLPVDQLSDDVQIFMDDSGNTGDPQLPYFNKTEAKILGTLLKSRPSHTRRFIAKSKGQVIAHAIAHQAANTPVVIGIYSVGVLPQYRNRGIGRAITLACAKHGRTQGCLYAVLNAANEFYKGFGFETQGLGQTWWMHGSVGSYITSPKAIDFANAIATGSLSALDTFRSEQELLTQPLRCGVTALELAAQFKQSSCGEWLLDHGAQPSILALWDLGLRTRLQELLNADPNRVNQKLGRSGATPLHLAILRNDTALAKMLLQALPDLTTTDDEAQSTPLGWARYFKRDEIAALIEQQIARQ